MPESRMTANSLRRSRFERDYVAIVAAFAVLMVLTNVIGTKLFLLLPAWLPQGFGWITDHHFVVLTTGLITYPLTFLLTDVCSEVWGRRRANYMVALGFACSLLMLLTVHVAGWVPRADRYWADAAAQPIHGTRTLAATPAGAARLAIDDGQYLVLGDAEPGLALALIPAGEHLRGVVLDYRALHTPSHEVPGEDGPVEVPLRWDQRCELELTAPLAEALPAGAWVVPAARVTAAEDGGRIRVDRPWLLPASTVQSTGLITAEGAVLNYAARDGRSGALEAGAVWNSPVALDADGLAPGEVLGVYQLRSPPQLDQAFGAVFSAPGSLLLGSMLAYLLAQFLDVWLYHFWRRVTGRRFLWLRNNGSTMISQLVDTIVVHVIFLPWAFGTPWGDVVKIIIGVYLVKMVLAWLDTPLIYLCTWIAKRRLGYAWHEEVDLDTTGTTAGYPTGLIDGLRRLVTRHHVADAPADEAATEPPHTSADEH